MELMVTEDGYQSLKAVPKKFVFTPC